MGETCRHLPDRREASGLKCRLLGLLQFRDILPNQKYGRFTLIVLQNLRVPYHPAEVAMFTPDRRFQSANRRSGDRLRNAPPDQLRTQFIGLENREESLSK